MSLPQNKSNPNNSTALVKTPPTFSRQLDFGQLTQQTKDRLRLFVPGDNATFERFLACVVQGSAGVYAMASADAARQKKEGPVLVDTASYLAVCKKLAAIGLYPGSDDAYLLAYRNNKAGRYTTQLIISPAGLRKLAYRNPVVKKINSGVVFAGDRFEPDECEGRFKLVRSPAPDARWTAETLQCAFAHMVTASDGIVTHHLHVSPIAEIEYARSFSQSPNRGAWADNWIGMCEKTALKRLLRKAPTYDEFLANATAETPTGALPIAPEDGEDGEYLLPDEEAHNGSD